MAQNQTSPPRLEGRVVWQHTVKADEKRINPRQLIAHADRDGGLFVASLVEGPALPNGNVPLLPTITRHDATGRVAWSRHLATTSYGREYTALSGSGLVAPNGDLWLVIPYPDQKDAPVVLARLGGADGKILQQRRLTFPRDPNFAPDHAGHPTRFMPLATGAVLMLGEAPADTWWLAWRDAAGGGWDLRLERPIRYAQHAEWSLNQDGSITLIALKYPDYWIARVSHDGKAGSWQRLPSGMIDPLRMGETIAYLEQEKDGYARTLKTLDLATGRTRTVRASIPPSHEPMNISPVDLSGMTSDGAFLMRTAWRNRAMPLPQGYREATLVSRDGQKMWRIELRMWDRIIDSRSALRIEPVAGAWQACPGPTCPGWNLKLVAYAP